MDYYELTNRRKFFKKAAKGIPPMLGTFVSRATLLLNA